MISIPQIKAARALLSWTQSDLARVSGISLGAIAQIERGAGNPRDETMRILQLALEKYDVEFLDELGVKIKKESFDVKVWQGREAMLNCFRDIEDTLPRGGELLLSCVDDELWTSMYPKEMLEMYKSRTALGIISLGLLTGPEKNKSNWPSKNYRIVPVQATSPLAPFYVYENKVAIIKMKDPIRILLVENQTIAESFRAQFTYHWENGEAF